MRLRIRCGTSFVTAGPHEAEIVVDFCQLFTREMKSLYSLALLLTGSPEKAERCFVSSLEDCLKGSAVGREWAHSWAKRVVIKKAIRLIASYVHCAETAALPVSSEPDEDPRNPHVGSPIVRCVLALGDFERLVFVMTVLERYSDCDSAILLGCRQQEIRAGRIRAVQELAAAHSTCDSIGCHYLSREVRSRDRPQKEILCGDC
jgi:DNA-directed RNA polymerase specialized sigma24 family protein